MKVYSMSKIYRYWILNKDIIDQPFETWLCEMLERSLYIPYKRGFITYDM
jgi:hypothetical protein